MQPSIIRLPNDATHFSCLAPEQRKDEDKLDSPDIAVARYAAQISLWALWVSGGALFISICVFALEIRRWLDEGVRLSMMVMANAKLFGGGQNDPNTYLSVIVTNRGSAPTTITHMVFFNYPSRLARYAPRRVARWIKSLRPQTFFVPNTGAPGPIPYLLQPGTNWFGMATYTPELEKMIAAGCLYVGIIGSHSDKTLFRRASQASHPLPSPVVGKQ
jgi:hypothetical protein